VNWLERIDAELDKVASQAGIDWVLGREPLPANSPARVAGDPKEGR
jgi:hypothetical protein